jgi:hypothetical protein
MAAMEKKSEQQVMADRGTPNEWDGDHVKEPARQEERCVATRHARGAAGRKPRQPERSERRG